MSDETSNAQAAKRAKFRRDAKTAGVLVGACAVAGTILWAVNGASKPDEEDAFRACEAALVAQMKNPDSADVEGRFNVTYTNDGTPSKITGKLSGENSFGATVTTDYVCKVALSGDEFSVLYAQINE